MFKCQITGISDSADMGPGEKLIRAHIGTIRPSKDVDIVSIGITKEKLIEIFADSLETEEAEISINFGDIRLLIPGLLTHQQGSRYEK